VGHVQYLADTSAAVRLLRKPDVLHKWHEIVENGLVAICPATELELLYTARTQADHGRQANLLRETFSWVFMPERVFEQAAKVQSGLVRMGSHRSAVPIDLLTAATAEAHRLELLHYDRDFLQVARVTGQPVTWLAEPGTLD
jgi:predicted nucleic acid-binding protein